MASGIYLLDESLVKNMLQLGSAVSNALTSQIKQLTSNNNNKNNKNNLVNVKSIFRISPGHNRSLWRATDQCCSRGLCFMYIRDNFCSLHAREVDQTDPALVEWDPSEIEAQSGEMPFSVSVASTESQEQNVTFDDKNPAYDYSVDSQPDATYAMSDIGDASLEHFFRRPIKIASYEWGTGTSLFYDFNPWQLYFEDLRVINRISNFNLLRSKLCLKVVINGNGFHYGRAILSYQPRHTLDAVTVNRSLVKADIVEASQRPHIYLDPTYSTGGTMTLPFFWDKNNLNIPNEEWRQMGECNLRSLNDLKHANGASDRVTISIFAWAEDVYLTIPTSVEPGSIAPQAGEMAKDEYGSGPVSKPASILARMAGAVTSAPIIGPYMRATQVAASSIATVARIFGYSRPPTLDAPSRSVITPIGNLTNTNFEDPVTKLSVDAKQELTIDPRTVGLGGTDELAIRNIAMRESYLTTFDWNVDLSTESLLWNSRVNPSLFALEQEEYHMTPMAYCVLPFQYWRGSLEFRFQIVASNFHKGRLAISFDPYYAATDEYNTQYTHIVDIASQKDFTVKCAWGNEHAYLLCRDPATNSFPYGTSRLTGANTAYDNGVLTVRVLNELTVPNSTADNNVQINVFVKACDDFEVAAPSDLFSRYTLFPEAPGGLTTNAFLPPLGIEPQSGEEGMADAEDTTEPSAPVQTQDSAVMAAPMSPSDMIKFVHFGEEIVSFRQMMKRYSQYAVHQPTDGASWTRMYKTDFPKYRGFDPVGVHATAGGNKYNYVQSTIINYIVPCFSGVRGGMRWKYVRVGDEPGRGSSIFARREVVTNQPYFLEQKLFWNNTSLTRQNHGALDVLPETFSGAAETNTSVDPCLEIELPFYAQRRFAAGRRLSSATIATQFGRHSVVNSWSDTSGNSTSTCKEYVSVGEDFSCFFFVSTPILYHQPNVPSPL